MLCGDVRAKTRNLDIAQVLLLPPLTIILVIVVGVVGVTTLTTFLINEISRQNDAIFTDPWWRLSSEVRDGLPFLRRVLGGDCGHGLLRGRVRGRGRRIHAASDILRFDKFLEIRSVTNLADLVEDHS